MPLKLVGLLLYLKLGTPANLWRKHQEYQNLWYTELSKSIGRPDIMRDLHHRDVNGKLWSEIAGPSLPACLGTEP